MLVETVNNMIVIEDRTMVSLGKEVPAKLVYDKYPDRDHGHFKVVNMEHYKLAMKEVNNQEIFDAIITYYGSMQSTKAYHKLQELGIIIKEQ